MNGVWHALLEGSSVHILEPVEANVLGALGRTAGNIAQKRGAVLIVEGKRNLRVGVGEIQDA
jgi:hypothetical protein